MAGRKGMCGCHRSRPEAEEKQTIAVLCFRQNDFRAGNVGFVIIRF